MNFRKRLQKDQPEINFIPLIDVLLVIIIFLVVSTTFSKFSELKINLPVAEANPVERKNVPINVTITEDGEYTINENILSDISIEAIQDKLMEISKKNQDKMPVIISADAKTNHQSVINVMEASRRAGLTKITFSTKVN
jgi:biopolymer transport protein ExbD